MADIESQVDLARKLQNVERDRVELVQQAVDVLRSIQSGNQTEMTESLAGVIGLAYLLGAQMGVSPFIIDQEILSQYQVNADLDEDRRPELLKLVRYLADRK